MTPNDKFVILASDGLWEVMSSDEAAQIVQNFGMLVCDVSPNIFSHSNYMLGQTRIKSSSFRQQVPH